MLANLAISTVACYMIVAVAGFALHARNYTTDLRANTYVLLIWFFLALGVVLTWITLLVALEGGK